MRFSPFSFINSNNNCKQFLISYDTKISYSNDIDAGSFTQSLTGSTFFALAHNNDFILGVSNNKVYKSFDGINWTNTSTLSNITIRRITWNGTYFVLVGNAVGAFNYQAYYSTDGVNWTGSNIFGGGSNVVSDISSNTTYTVYVSNQVAGNQQCIFRSTDNGINFTSNSNGLLSQGLTSNEANGKFYISGTLVSVPKTYYSNNGLTWNNLGTSISNGVLRGIAYNGDIYVAVGSPTGTTDDHVATSTDGINWTKNSGLTGLSAAGKIVWNGTYFVMINQSNVLTEDVLYRSTDGINWTGISGLTHSGYDIISLVSPYTSPSFPINNFCG